MASLSNMEEAPTCPITMDIMAEPTLCTVDGHTYERAAIEAVVRSSGSSPMTRQPVQLTDLVPNRAIQEATEAFQRLVSQLQQHRHHVIPFTELRLSDDAHVGMGAYKEVHKGRWKGRTVAVALVKSGGVAESEIQNLVDLGRHVRVIRFHGQSTHPDGRRIIVTEFARHGALGGERGLLERLDDAGKSLSPSMQLEVLRQVSEGMAEVAAQGFVHRDISARNILVTHLEADSDDGAITGINVKIADLGLARSLGIGSAIQTGQVGQLPVRWMAPEALRRNRFSEKTDVFAFGVLAWEILSGGDVPWTLGVSDERVSELVIRGERLPRPENCSDGVWEVVESCWTADATSRSTFQQLVSSLQDLRVCVEVEERVGRDHKRPKSNAAAGAAVGGAAAAAEEEEEEESTNNGEGAHSAETWESFRALVAGSSALELACFGCLQVEDEKGPKADCYGAGKFMLCSVCTRAATSLVTADAANAANAVLLTRAALERQLPLSTLRAFVRSMPESVRYDFARLLTFLDACASELFMPASVHAQALRVIERSAGMAMTPEAVAALFVELMGEHPLMSAEQGAQLLAALAAKQSSALSYEMYHLVAARVVDRWNLDSTRHSIGHCYYGGLADSSSWQRMLQSDRVETQIKILEYVSWSTAHWVTNPPLATPNHLQVLGGAIRIARGLKKDYSPKCCFPSCQFHASVETGMCSEHARYMSSDEERG